MKAEIKNANIRGCECGVNKSGEPYILVYAEDEDGEYGELIDKNMDRKDIYKRNAVVDIKADIVSAVVAVTGAQAHKVQVFSMN